MNSFRPAPTVHALCLDGRCLYTVQVRSRSYEAWRETNNEFRHTGGKFTHRSREDQFVAKSAIVRMVRY